MLLHRTIGFHAPFRSVSPFAPRAVNSVRAPEVFRCRRIAAATRPRKPRLRPPPNPRRRNRPRRSRRPKPNRRRSRSMVRWPTSMSRLPRPAAISRSISIISPWCAITARSVCRRAADPDLVRRRRQLAAAGNRAAPGHQRSAVPHPRTEFRFRSVDAGEAAGTRHRSRRHRGHQQSRSPASKPRSALRSSALPAAWCCKRTARFIPTSPGASCSTACPPACAPRRPWWRPWPEPPARISTPNSAISPPACRGGRITSCSTTPTATGWTSTPGPASPTAPAWSSRTPPSNW